MHPARPGQAFLPSLSLCDSGSLDNPSVLVLLPYYGSSADEGVFSPLQKLVKKKGIHFVCSLGRAWTTGSELCRRRGGTWLGREIEPRLRHFASDDETRLT